MRQVIERAVYWHQEGRLEDAEKLYLHILEREPEDFDAKHLLGLIRYQQGKDAEALSLIHAALRANPNVPGAWSNYGCVLLRLRRPEEALASYDKALAIKPDYAEALFNRGNTLQLLKRFEEALLSYSKALAVNPDHPRAFSGIAGSALKMCDWAWTAKVAGEIEARVSKGRSIIEPFTLMSYCDDLSLLLECARRYVRLYMSVRPAPLWKGAVWRNGKIRIAYLSGAFHASATSRLIAELLELHDRDRFEIVGVSYGPNDRSNMRSRVIKAFDQFHDVRFKSDREIAMFLHQLQVDIAVCLDGYTGDSRPGILAFRPAPIQVNYLGFPGTMGVDFIDYVIADKILAPFDHQKFCTEKIVHLPECFQVNDSKRIIAESTPTRQQVGLPEEAFVFCCFNNSYKITPAVFDVWMRLLRSVEQSVLWLLRDNEAAERNLRREAAIRSVDPARLVFADRLKHDQHLARHRLADLFLDTFPVNAGTTASDALWAGLPVLSYYGKSVTSRLGASLLYAIGLPELATDSLEGYQALGLRLATDRSFIKSIRQKLEQNRTSCPLFDTSRYCRHIEAAYTTMWELWQRGESPRHFSVELRER